MDVGNVAVVDEDNSSTESQNDGMIEEVSKMLENVEVS